MGEESSGLRWINLGDFSKSKDAGFLAGVSLPKGHPELPTGERFWLKRDFTLLEEALNLGIDASSCATPTYRVSAWGRMWAGAKPTYCLATQHHRLSCGKGR